jgi:hypothetical protein
MFALIFEENACRRGTHAVALIQAGLEVTSTDQIDVARDCLRADMVDLLILDERVHGRVSHGLALLAEYRNPLVATILLTSRTGEDVDDLFHLLPSLHCVLPPDVSAVLLRRFARASIIGASAVSPPLLLLPSQRIVEDDHVGVLPFATTRQRPPAPFCDAASA